MACIFKPTYSILIPADSEIIQRKGKRYARFKGKDGRKVVAAIVENKKDKNDPRERCLVKSECWYYKFRSTDGIVKRKGFKDKEATRQLAAREEKEAAFEAGAGVVDPFKQHRKRTLSEHLSDYERCLQDKGRDANYVQTTVQRVRDVIAGCRFVLISDVSPSKVQAFLADLRRSGRSTASSNHYLTAVKMFINWMVKDRRTADNPIAGMSRQNTDSDRRRVRRPLDWEEFDRLLQAAAGGPEIQGVSGTDRVILYVVACYTGYRRNEIGSVTRRSFDFESSPPTLTVAAGYSKRRRRDVIPLRQDFAELIREWLGNSPSKDDDAPLFQVTKKRTADMVRTDLAAARESWIKDAPNATERKNREESCLLCYVDADGRYADFHALRKTFITNLSRAGVSPKLAQTLARHSDINLTMNTYTTLEIHDQSAAVEGLPAIPEIARKQPAAQLKATGTDDTTGGGSKALVPALVPTPDFPCPRASSRGNEPADRLHGQETQKPLKDDDLGIVRHPEASRVKVPEEGLEPSRALSPLDFEFSRTFWLASDYRLTTEFVG